MTSFLTPPSEPAPAMRIEAVSAAERLREIEGALGARLSTPNLDPVLREIARVASELLRHPRVGSDGDALRLLALMAWDETMDRFEAHAEALRVHLAASPQTPPPATPRAGRVLLRL